MFELISALNHTFPLLIHIIVGIADYQKHQL